jgi:hypothetical protein
MESNKHSEKFNSSNLLSKSHSEENDKRAQSSKVVVSNMGGRLKIENKERKSIEEGEIEHPVTKHTNCEKCGSMKDQTIRGIKHIKTYIDSLNDRVNMAFNKINPVKVSSSSLSTEIDYSVNPEYYHTIYYSDLDKLNISPDVTNQFRNLMKSVRLFNDKLDYITRKHQNFERMVEEHKNYKLSNKLEKSKENLSGIEGENVDEVKNLTVQTIFKNFNVAKENFENIMKDLKSNLTTEKQYTNNITVNNLYFIYFFN